MEDTGQCIDGHASHKAVLEADANKCFTLNPELWSIQPSLQGSKQEDVQLHLQMLGDWTWGLLNAKPVLNH